MTSYTYPTPPACTLGTVRQIPALDRIDLCRKASPAAINAMLRRGGVILAGGSLLDLALDDLALDDRDGDPLDRADDDDVSAGRWLLVSLPRAGADCWRLLIVIESGYESRDGDHDA